MGIGLRAAQAILAPVKGVAQAALAAKPLTGAVIGGAYGGFSTDEYSSNQIARNALVGAAIGGGIGGLITGPGRRFLGEVGMGIAGKAKGLVISSNQGSFGSRLKQGGIARMGTSIAGAAGRAGLFAVNHPYLATGMAAGAVGVASNISGGMSGSLSAEQRGEYAVSAGTSSPSRQMLQDSTYGLTQGLHRNRH